MQKKAFWLMCLLLWLAIGASSAQEGVRVVIVNDFSNVRIVPAIGADVIATVPAGYLFDIVTGRTADFEWLRVDFNGGEGWINVATLTVLSGDIDALPVADPRSIPYGGFDAPRAGFTSATSDITGYLPNTGVHVRAGPSTGYPRLAEAFRFTTFPLLGRTANSGWLQVNFEGTLGWVASQYVQPSAQLSLLPIDGIVAEAAPISDGVAEDLVATLRLLRARLDLAQPSLDSIRIMWTDAALNGRASCRPYPAQPSGYNIPNPLLAAFYNILNPLIVDFNDAMFNVRYSIDLFIDVCNQPGTINPVGQATTIGALQTIALADRQFAELRRRLDELIPPDRQLGENECLFGFQNAFEILPIITVGQLVLDNFTPRRIVTGYCIDLIAGQTLIFETLQLDTSNVVHQLSVSPFDNPTNFLAVGRGTAGNRNLVVGPLPVTTTGRYLVVLSNIAETPPQGEFALLVSVPVGISGASLIQDPNTGQVIVQQPTQQPFLPTATQGFPFAPPGATSVIPPFLLTPQLPLGNESQPTPNPNVCPSIAFTCSQLTTCQQAYSCLAAGAFSLDPDEDGIPCGCAAGVP